MPEATPVRLNVGPFSALLADGELRDIRLLGHRAIDAIYVRVRGPRWATIPGVLSNLRCSSSGLGFTASWDCLHRGAGIEFGWHGSITASGQDITFRLDGQALTEFDTRRIGFCFLHPAELAGTAITVASGDGETMAQFPARVSPHPILTGATALSYEVSPGARIDIDLGGELLETEDHRNWTDPGWKTYSPPLAEPAPRRMRQGDRVSQTLVLRGSTAPGATSATDASETVELSLGPADGVLPGLGIVFADGGEDEARSLLRLAPTVLYVELAEGADWRGRLARAAAMATRIGSTLSAGLAGADPGWLAAVATALAELDQALGTVAVFSPLAGITPDGAAGIVRRLLPGVPVGGGTRLHFGELNRGGPQRESRDWDFAAFAVTPQAHHTDDASVLATIRGQEPALTGASTLLGGAPVVVGPVSLRKRTGSFAPASPLDVGDPRECQPLGIAWLCATVITMHAASCLIFLNPAVDASGVSEAGDGVEEIFAELATLAGRPVQRVRSDPRRVAALAVGGQAGPPRLVLSNLTPSPVTVRLGDRSWLLDGYEARICDLATA